jgi:hypothetical protein
VEEGVGFGGSGDRRLGAEACVRGTGARGREDTCQVGQGGQ